MTIQAKILTPNSITLVVDGQTYNLTDESHKYYKEIREALKQNDNDEAERLLDLVDQFVSSFKCGRVSIVDGVVSVDGRVVVGPLTERMVQMADEGFSVDPMVNFLNNLYENPSKRSVDELYGFLEETDLPITDDGHFIAYKMVRDDYKDIYSGTMDNSVGSIVEMPRNAVDEDKDRTCSAGLHFCSQGYLGHYGGSGSRVMILKINPKDVVSIPVDYKNAKGRACRYEVIGEIENKIDRNHSFGTAVYTLDDESDWDDDLYDDMEY